MTIHTLQSLHAPQLGIVTQERYKNDTNTINWSVGQMQEKCVQFKQKFDTEIQPKLTNNTVLRRMNLCDAFPSRSANDNFHRALSVQWAELLFDGGQTLSARERTAMTWILWCALKVRTLLRPFWRLKRCRAGRIRLWEKGTKRVKSQKMFEAMPPLESKNGLF